MEDGSYDMVGYLPYHYFTDLFAFSLHDRVTFLFTNIGAYITGSTANGIFCITFYTKVIKELVDKISIQQNKNPPG